MKDDVPKKPDPMYVHPERDEVDEGYVRRPRKGHSKHGYESRSEADKDYVNPLKFESLVQDPRIAVRQTNAMNTAFTLLWNAELIDSKSQFAAGILQMVKTPVSIADAAAICDCSRQWFRNLEVQGRLIILRNTDRKTYITAEDLVKVLEGTI